MLLKLSMEKHCRRLRIWLHSSGLRYCCAEYHSPDANVCVPLSPISFGGCTGRYTTLLCAGNAHDPRCLPTVSLCHTYSSKPLSVQKREYASPSAFPFTLKSEVSCFRGFMMLVNEFGQLGGRLNLFLRQPRTLLIA